MHIPPTPTTTTKTAPPLLTGGAMSWPCRGTEKERHTDTAGAQPKSHRGKWHLTKNTHDGGSRGNYGFFGSGELLIGRLISTPS